MKQKIFYFILSCLLLVSCEAFHKDESIEYISNIVKENYDAVVQKTDESILQSMGRDSFITQLGYIRDSVCNNISGEIEYHFGGGHKNYSMKNGKEVYQDYTQIIVSNNEKYMPVTLSYNRSGKVIDLYTGPVAECSSTSFFTLIVVAVILLIAIVVLVIVLKNKYKREVNLIRKHKSSL